MELLKALNPPQQDAVTTVTGPVIVFAGAGSGKTRVLTYRVAYLLHSGLATPREIMAVTFTNKAAGEMKERVADLLSKENTKGFFNIMLGTFHSVALRILRQEAQNGSANGGIGIPLDFVIYDAQDQLHLVRGIVKDFSLDEKFYRPQGILAQISSAKSALLGPKEYATRTYGFSNRTNNEITGRVYLEYQKRLKEQHALDFDDLIVETINLFSNYPEILAKYQNRFKFVLVDEYQDLNLAQYVMVKYFALQHRNICVVGDDDQSIYSFRGADAGLIYKFQKDFPEAKMIKLEQNYRSTKKILQLANALVKNNPHRSQKNLWTKNSDGNLITSCEALNERDEANFAVNCIKNGIKNQERQYKDYAILYRTNAQSRSFEEALLQEGIPYMIVGGLRFYERKEIKDLLAYLRVLQNPYDAISFKRILNVPQRHVGSVTINKIFLWAKEKDEAVFNSLFHLEDIPSLASKTKNALIGLRQLLEKLLALKGTLGITDLVRIVLEESRYLEELEREGTEESFSRIENLEEFLSVAREFEEMSIEEINGDRSLDVFLSRISLSSDMDSWQDKQDTVVLMTLHSAKGLEFPVVFLAGLEEGLFPHSRSLISKRDIEEERRLCYVGITRAREELYLTRTYSRILHGLPSFNQPSRFLEELPPNLINEISQKETIKKDPLQNKSRPQKLQAAAFSMHIPAGPREGDKINHPQWGPGIVISNKKLNNEEEITVAFNEHGIRKFALKELVYLMS